MSYRKCILICMLLILWTLLSVVDANACSCAKHIFCLYPTYTPGPKCEGHIKSGFQPEERKIILEAMNKYRSMVAMGKESLGNPGPQPPAADMIEVTWDDYLESTAQRLADQCEFEHSDTTCRVTDENEYFGENLATRSYSDERMYNDEDVLKRIKNWYDEVKDFPENLVDSYSSEGGGGAMIGHYAQMILGKTYRIGCGRTRYALHSDYVCHFKPGIYADEPVYTRGDPASKCPEGSITSKYEGLCALEKYSRGSINCYSSILISSLFAVLVMANTFLNFQQVNLIR